MDKLDIAAIMGGIEQAARKRAHINFYIGDALVAARALSDGDPAWKSAYKSGCGIPLSISEMGLMTAAAESYGPEERAYDLPWCHYAYAVRNTTDPCSWIRRAYDEQWDISRLQTEIRTVKAEINAAAAAEIGNDLPPLKVYVNQITSRAGASLGSITAYVDILRSDVEPRIVVDLHEDTLFLDEAEEVLVGLSAAVESIREFLGAASIQGMPEGPNHTS